MLRTLGNGIDEDFDSLLSLRVCKLNSLQAIENNQILLLLKDSQQALFAF